MLKIVDFGDFIFAKIFFARSTLKTLIIKFERKKSMSLNPAQWRGLFDTTLCD